MFQKNKDPYFFLQFFLRDFPQVEDCMLLKYSTENEKRKSEKRKYPFLFWLRDWYKTKFLMRECHLVDITIFHATYGKMRYLAAVLPVLKQIFSSKEWD